MREYLNQIEENEIQKLVFSNGKNPEYKKICVVRKKEGYQIERYTDKQVFHENVTTIDLPEICEVHAAEGYRQIDIFTTTTQYGLKLSKKGKVLFHKNPLEAPIAVPVSHNRKKHYLLEEGEAIAPLVDMGIFTKEGRVAASMYDKFKQINRFLEIIDDAVREQTLEHYSIIDFGCGKSYLTFIVYHYFTYIKKIPVKIIGIDLKADIIKKCNEAAKRYGYDSLSFALGDIDGYTAPFDVDLVLSLHACDTATDYALYNAVRWNAKMIFSVPCCQHELNGQMQPESLALLSRYGIIQERFAALSTDAIRGSLLEYSGYKTQLLEFVDLSHTPKNILIRAVRKPVMKATVKEKRLAEAEQLMKEFHFQPTLYRLLIGEK